MDEQKPEQKSEAKPEEKKEKTLAELGGNDDFNFSPDKLTEDDMRKIRQLVEELKKKQFKQ
jgi:hypothetical protein